MQTLLHVPHDFSVQPCSSCCPPAAPSYRHSLAPVFLRKSSPQRFHGVRAVSEQDRGVDHFSKLASEAASSLRRVASQAVTGVGSKEFLQQQTEATAAELRVHAEQLRAQALAASNRLTSIVGRTEEERAAVLQQGNQLLFSAAGQLRAQVLTARFTAARLLKEAEGKKGVLLEAAKGAPEPIRDIAETAVTAHSLDAARKGAVIHDFCLGITYGGLLVAGGLVWFVATGSINAIRFGVFLGGFLLAAAVGSLRAWRAGQSSTPYIAAQAVTAYLLFARELQRYSQTQVLFPTAVVAVSSIAMVAFYVYVVLAGGNPPPKKKPTAPAS